MWLWNNIIYGCTWEGFKPGDPLFLYLFLLCVEGLSNAIDVASNNSEISGCQIFESAPVVSHLLFADDNFLFFKAPTVEATNNKSLLVNYESAQVNPLIFRSQVRISVRISSRIRRRRFLIFWKFIMISQIQNIWDSHRWLGGQRNMYLVI